jgi:CAAX protease family protein
MATNLVAQPTPKDSPKPAMQADQLKQYTLWQLLGIWLVGGAPMWLLGWVAYPILSAGLASVDAAILRFKLLTIGLVWEFALAMIILYREEGNIRPSTVRRRFWLNHPVSVTTGKTNKSLWWWIIPLILLVAFLEVGLRSMLVNVWTTIFPFFAQPKGYDVSGLFSPDLRARWVVPGGSWDCFL